MQVAAMFGEGKGGVVEKPDPGQQGMSSLSRFMPSRCVRSIKGFIGGGTGERFGHEAAGEVVEVAQPGARQSRRPRRRATPERLR